MPSVAVVGWYSHHNIGDEAFKVAFRRLWPDVHFEFFDTLPHNLTDFDALVFGGGSFMEQLPVGNAPVPKMPIAFIGVGLHTTPNARTREWMDAAKVVVVRNQPPPGVGEVLMAPDLVFGVKWLFPRRLDTQRRILVLGNDFATPHSSAPSWRTLGSYWFEQELAPILDQEVKDGAAVVFYPMQASPTGFLKEDDRLWNGRIASLMECRRMVSLHEGGDEWDLTSAIRESDLVISLRYHGCVFSTIFGATFVGISMHDKTKSYFVENGLENYCDFYGFNKEIFRRAIAAQPSQDQLATIREEGYKRWQLLSATVRDTLGW